MRSAACRRFPGSVASLVLIAIVATSCVSAGRGPSGPVESPTGIVYPPGTPPEETRYSQTATLYLRQNRVDRALELALQGLEEDPENPVHYYLAGAAYARLGETEAADSLFARAQEIYPAYELEIEPEREAAWAEAFNAGTEAYNSGDVEAAVDAWRNAIAIFDLRPEAHRNLASALAAEGRYDEAIDVYRGALRGLEKEPATRVLDDGDLALREEQRADTEGSLAQLLLFRGRFSEAEPLLRRRLERDPESVRGRSDLARALNGLGRDEEAAALYGEILSEDQVEASELFNLGVALFRSGDYTRAAEAFERLTRLQPNSRDAWFNYANALFAGQDWESLANVGDRLVELDPLGENAQLITARAHLEIGDENGARRGLELAESAPVHVEGLQLSPAGAETVVRGRVVGNGADPGSVVRLRFTFYGNRRALGTEILSVDAPDEDESADFQVTIPTRAESYRYELVE